ncbi:hypothetical protein KIN20_035725 [Parelaphostrongylus tenuis]|uniref:Uncharacterized protein n=1 Tax=Parelaphostrongylus tenuis TaxID=148309 RepID=A0AAD5RC13_PARTN|nr:hypothetical protein KIN20_035725 [Parelaphostrongylus tenuis]
MTLRLNGERQSVACATDFWNDRVSDIQEYEISDAKDSWRDHTIERIKGRQEDAHRKKLVLSQMLPQTNGRRALGLRDQSALTDRNGYRMTECASRTSSRPSQGISINDDYSERCANVASFLKTMCSST